MDLEKIISNIHWLGHDTFRIDASKVIYFDPYQIGRALPADLILITHEHYDHCSADDVRKIQRAGTVIVTNRAAARKLTGDVRTVKPGEHLEIDGVGIEVVPAYNINKPFHPRKAGMLGFIITLDGVRYYHAGDTDLIPEMENVDADVAFLPVSGTYVMTAKEAAEAVRVIGPALVVPMHYGAIVGSAVDAEAFRDAVDDVRVVVPVKE